MRQQPHQNHRRHSGARVKRASYDVQLHIGESITPVFLFVTKISTGRMDTGFALTRAPE